MNPPCTRCAGKLMREPGMFPGEGDALVCMICGSVTYSDAEMAASYEEVAIQKAKTAHTKEAFRLTLLARAEASR